MVENCKQLHIIMHFKPAANPPRPTIGQEPVMPAVPCMPWLQTFFFFAHEQERACMRVRSAVEPRTRGADKLTTFASCTCMVGTLAHAIAACRTRFLLLEVFVWFHILECSHDQSWPPGAVEQGPLQANPVWLAIHSIPQRLKRSTQSRWKATAEADDVELQCLNTGASPPLFAVSDQSNDNDVRPAHCHSRKYML